MRQLDVGYADKSDAGYVAQLRNGLSITPTGSMDSGPEPHVGYAAEWFIPE